MKTIAWIEDDTDIIDPVVELLEDAGYKITRYNTIAEAMQHRKEIERADLILLDMIVRPGKNERRFGQYPGLELLQEWRAEKIDTPVIVLSVVERDAVTRQLRDLGVADIIHKPVRPSELKERVEHVLEKKK